MQLSVTKGMFGNKVGSKNRALEVNKLSMKIPEKVVLHAFLDFDKKNNVNHVILTLRFNLYHARLKGPHC